MIWLSLLSLLYLREARMALSKAQQAENARRKARMREHKERFRIRCIEAEANGEPPPCAYCLEQGIVMRVFVGSKPETIPCPVCSEQT